MPTSTLLELMNTPLPSKNKQRRGIYQPKKSEVLEIYAILNACIFDNKLSMPSISLRSMKYWGLCLGYDAIQFGRHYSKIRLFNKYPCKQWMIVILAHEMVHQWQWDIIGPERIAQGKQALLSHGPSFYAFRDKLAIYGIPLKSKHCAVAWMQHQTIMKI